MTPEEEYLYERIHDLLTVRSDEAEGTQIIDIYNINACNPDYVETEKPRYTVDEIRHMLHLDDPAVFPGSGTAADGETGTGTGADSTSGPPLIDNIGTSDTPAGNIPGTDGSGLAGDRAETPADDGKDEYDSPADTFEKWSGISIPDDTDIPKLLDAIINDSAVGPNRIIMEFATPSLQDERGVDYELYVKPGQKLTENTVIGRATVNGVTKEIKSIFSSGTVARNDTGGFRRLFESCGADRHIIIEDYEICGDRPDINTDRIQEMIDDFTDEAFINQLVCDNMADSVLPVILQKRYEEYAYVIGGPLRLIDQRPNGREIFSRYMDEVQKIKDEYLEDIKSMGTEDNIRKTNGNIRKINKLGNSIIERRQKYSDDLVRMYSEYSRTLDPCEFDDDEFHDCKYLAWDHEIDYRDKKVNMKIGNTEYSNYYVNLLSKVDLTNGKNSYATEYYGILKEIIEIRMCHEKYKIEEIAAEFDDMFKRSVNKSYKEAYKKMRADMIGRNKDVSYSDAYSWIAERAGKTKTKKGEQYAEFAQRQLANIFMFMWNYHEYKLPASPEEEKEITPMDLVRDEWRKISEFWDKVLAVRERLTIGKCTEQFRDFAKTGERYHVWPPCSRLTIGGDVYDHYLFQNHGAPDEAEDDEELGTDYGTTAPEIPDEMEPPQDDNGPDDMLPGENDVEDNEVSLIDFKYWQRYFGLATIISIPFLNCGLDIIPFVQLVPLPVICMAIASVYIRALDIVIVFGITIRGMYIFPCVLFVNLSSAPLSITTALVAALKTVQSKINAKINAIAENGISSIADAMMQILENDNRRLRNENLQIDAAISALEAKKVANQENIKKMFERIYKPDARQTQQINDPLSNLK